MEINIDVGNDFLQLFLHRVIQSQSFLFDYGYRKLRFSASKNQFMVQLISEEKKIIYIAPGRNETGM